MELKITLRNKKSFVTRTSAPTIDSFMEELAMLSSGTFVESTKYITKYGDFFEIYGTFVRYSEIDIVEEFLT